MSGMSREIGKNDSAPLSMAVITALAEHEEVEPVELDPQLYEVIDPDALDGLFTRHRDTTRSTTGRLTFSYNGYDVDVTSDGDVRISDSRDP